MTRDRISFGGILSSTAVLALKRNCFGTKGFGNATSLTKVKSSYTIFDRVIDNPRPKGFGILLPLWSCFYLYF